MTKSYLERIYKYIKLTTSKCQENNPRGVSSVIMFMMVAPENLIQWHQNSVAHNLVKILYILKLAKMPVVIKCVVQNNIGWIKKFFLNIELSHTEAKLLNI